MEYALIFLFLLKLTIYSTHDISQSVWKHLQYTSLIEDTITFEEYLHEGNCQTMNNTCLNIRKKPRGRHLHTAVIYTTYNTTQENQMCPEDFCGPLCINRSKLCAPINGFEKFNYSLSDIDYELKNFSDPSTEDCPDNCCDASNEYCFRKYDNTGNLIESNQEIILFFGGISQREVIISRGENIADNCRDINDYEIPGNLKNLTDTLYLINNCGYEILNEIWSYNIIKHKWTYIKPFVNSIKSKVIQKPVPRYGHSSVYLEKIDTSVSPAILRKYMFIYGGFSQYCENLCDDIWSYEIAYAPQRYFPLSNDPSEWNRGNVWNLITPDSATPGKRIHHSMVVDSKYEYIYLFGGMSLDSNNEYILNNDLWRYDIKFNNWEKIITQGILHVMRQITYWDGSEENIFISPDEYDPNIDTYKFEKEDSQNSILIPSRRCFHNMDILKDNGEEFLYMFGGYSHQKISEYNVQIQLNDLWKYSITENTWLEVFHSSEDVPQSRYGANLKWIDNKKLLLFGGVNSYGVLKDLWIYNNISNKWIEINFYEQTDETWPMPTKFSTMMQFSKGLIVYGGSFFLNGILDDSIYDNHQIFNRSRSSYVLNDIWIINSNECTNDCNNRGRCEYSSCICDHGYSGTFCEHINCPNSFCYDDLDIWSSERCHHCSGHGNCIESKCHCDNGWIGHDCSFRDCPNKCSADIDPNFGQCFEIKPLSQCVCNETLKRGGDDCSLIYCLNDCNGKGSCNGNDGRCSCNEGYYGIDCSLKVISFRNLGEYLVIYFNFMIIFIFIIFI